MAVKTKLPMGIENFKEMRTRGYYYIDKTGLIRDLLVNFGKVTLFTRPRRFGKTLNMSMLKYFFEIGSDSTLFVWHSLLQKTVQGCGGDIQIRDLEVIQKERKGTYWGN